MDQIHEKIQPESTSKSHNLQCVPKLVCVQYPGIVKNVEKAIETLGGIEDIEIATSNVKKNLELRFRPKDLYCKAAIADRERKPNIVLKIKIKKTINSDKVIKNEVIDYDVFGISALTFKFNKLCDFQYLPLVSKIPQEAETDLEYVYNKIIPDDLPKLELISNEEETLPLFFPPSSFSKFHSSSNQLYFDRSRFYEGRFTPEYYKKFKEQEIQQKIYRKDKGKAISQGAFLWSFEDDIPSGPSQACLDTLSVKYTSQNCLSKVKKLFDERPIWSKQALIYSSGVSVEQMRYILPTIAYYYVSGPWRIMWVKFGYDPRKDPNARIYQTFDYRVRTAGGFKLRVKPKRAYSRGGPLGSKCVSKFSLQQEYDNNTNEGMQENVFILKPGMVPPARQMFYQFCDVYLPEIKAMLARLPPVLPGTKCHKKNGWLPSGFTEQCREIANKYIGAQVKKEIKEEKSIENEGEVSDKDMMEQEPDNEFLEISDSSSSSSDSEDESMSKKKFDDDSENEIDMETVEEINRMIDMSTSNKKHLDVEQSTSKTC